jgi:hypothetical protein
VLAVYHPSVATVYSLLREPSLAFLWTHGCTFYVRPFPSGYFNPWTGARHTLDANLKALENGSPVSEKTSLGSSVIRGDSPPSLSEG